MPAVRPALARDERRLALIDHACWSAATDPGEHWEAERPFFGEPTETRPEDVLVAVEAGIPVGYVKIRPEHSPYGEWYIAGLGVAPEARRRGVARRLVVAAVARAETRGGRDIWLKVLSSNDGALALYATLGFREVARFRAPFRGRPGVDDLRLTRSVRSPEW